MNSKSSRNESNIRFVILPEKFLNVLPLIPPFFVDVGVGEDDGPAPIPVDFRPGLEDVVVHQADVTLVQQGVLCLKEIEKTKCYMLLMGNRVKASCLVGNELVPSMTKNTASGHLHLNLNFFELISNTGKPHYMQSYFAYL